MQMITDRRRLHQIPELELCLPKTVEYLKAGLEGLSCRLFSPIPGSLCAFFDFGKTDTLAFRADCDALPVTEQTGAAYASTHPGCMHACGHDGHMAILLELARRLSRKTVLAHNVLLVFQPGEECPGGARLICETGVFDQYRVKAIFALHLWPGLAKGVIASRKNEMMARSGEVTVEFTGRSAHIAKAAEGLDAMAAFVSFYTQAQALEESLPPQTFRLLKFGRVESGTVRNAISAHTRLEGSLRTFRDETWDFMRSGLRSIAQSVEEKTGCTVTLSIANGYPAVMNPPALFHRVMSCAPFETLEKPNMTAEDFSYYQKQLPGMLFFLGLGDVPPLHSTHFDFDETILSKGADFFEKLATDFV